MNVCQFFRTLVEYMAHLGLSLAPIGQGTYRNAPLPINNNSNNESVWEINTNEFTPPVVGNNYQPGGLNWARNRRRNYNTPKPKTQRNVPNRPIKGSKPPSTPTHKVFRTLKRKAPEAPEAPEAPDAPMKKKKMNASSRRGRKN